jgi:hypothetical protein
MVVCWFGSGASASARMTLQARTSSIVSEESTTRVFLPNIIL